MVVEHELELIKKIWRDPVWSKVIAAGIVGMFALFGFGHKQVSTLVVVLLGLLSVSIPLWLAGLACITPAVVSILSGHARGPKFKNTLQVIAKTEANYWWGEGRSGENVAMQIVGSATATNISDGPSLFRGLNCAMACLGKSSCPDRSW